MSQRAPEGNQRVAKTDQKGSKITNTAPKSSLGAFDILVFVTLSFVRQSCKNGRGTRVGLTNVKVTSVKNVFFLFFFCSHNCKNCHGALVGLTNVKGPSVEKSISSY